MLCPHFLQCCHHGQVRLDPLPVPPQQLHTLLTVQSRLILVTRICNHNQQISGSNHQMVGIDLGKPIFAHGQLYIAFSCAVSSDDDQL